MVETFGTGKLPDAEISRLVEAEFDLRPGAFRRYLDLHRPIFQKTAAYGHFGREDADFTWERTDRADALREAAGRGRHARLTGRAARSRLEPNASERVAPRARPCARRGRASGAPVAWSTRWTTSPGSATPAKTKL